MKRTLIIGRDAFLVATMRMALKFASDVAVVGVRDTGDSVRHAVRDAAPDIILLDGGDDPDKTIERVAVVAEERPQALLLVLGGSLSTALVERLLDAGVAVCLSRALQAEQIERLLGGERDAEPKLVAPPAPAAPAVGKPAAPPSTLLTNRELEILRCVAEGHTNGRIARDLWVTEQTVKFHLTNIYRKLGVTNRTEASRYMLLNDQRAETVVPAAPTQLRRPDGGSEQHRYAPLEAVR
jgi:DNA-binding NarL/FixJ family response regulator